MMDLHKERMADRRLSWLRWASLPVVGLAAVMARLLATPLPSRRDV
jgi:hypothetical protein